MIQQTILNAFSNDQKSHEQMLKVTLVQPYIVQLENM